MSLSNQLHQTEERIAAQIVDAAVAIHRVLGPGLLEQVYETCFCYELTKRGLGIERQVLLPIYYEGVVLEQSLRLDILVEDLIVCELKSVEMMLPIHTAQTVSYLRLSGRRLGFLINFNVPLLKQGIKRIVI